jgi:hypothetical protein
LGIKKPMSTATMYIENSSGELRLIVHSALLFFQYISAVHATTIFSAKDLESLNCVINVDAAQVKFIL